MANRKLDKALEALGERAGVNAVWGSELAGYTVDVETEEVAAALRAEFGSELYGEALSFNVMTEAQYEALAKMMNP